MTTRLTVAQAVVRFLANQYSERDGVEQRLVPGCFGIFGHGNVAGVGQALLEVAQTRRQGRVRCPTTSPATSRAWCTPPSASPGCATGCRRWPARRRSGRARPTCSPAPRWRRPTASRCSCCRPTSSRRGSRARCCRSWRSPRTYDVSVNDAFRPLSRFFDRVWRPEQLPSALLGAMRVLTDPAETGAVTIALPQDVQAEAHDWPDELFAERVWHIARARARARGARPRGGADPVGPAAAGRRGRRRALQRGHRGAAPVRRGHRHPGRRHAGRQGRAAVGPPAGRRRGRVHGLPRRERARPRGRRRDRGRHPLQRLHHRVAHRVPEPGRAVRQPQRRGLRRGQARGRDARGRRAGGPRRTHRGARRVPRRRTPGASASQRVEPRRRRGVPTSGTSRCPAQTEVLGALNEEMDAPGRRGAGGRLDAR